MRSCVQGISKCAKGVNFLHMLLGELNLVDLPGVIVEDNQGAIFLANNKQVSQCTKHIDLKHHFIREFIGKTDGIKHGTIFKIDTKENTADIGTKNIEVPVFNCLVECRFHTSASFIATFVSFVILSILFFFSFDIL